MQKDDVCLRLSHVNLRILIGAGLEGDPVVGGVGERNLALEDGAGREDNLALDAELGAILEARHLAALEELVEARHLLVDLGVEVHGGGDALALGREHEPEVLGNYVGVTAHTEEVGARLDGCEALPAHHDGSGVFETLDRSAHRSLELVYLGAVAIRGVDSLVVLDHGERDNAVVLVEHLLELVEPDPEVVGVEVGVLLGVLECLLIRIGALGRLAQEHVLVAGPDGEVAALLVSLGPLSNLHDEGLVRLGKVVEEVDVKGSTKVVGIGDKHVLDAGVEELLEDTGTGEGGVQIAVAGGAPLLDGSGGELGGLEGRLVDLGDLVLHNLPVAADELSVVLEGILGVGAGGEGVHEHALDVARRLAEAHNLLCDKVEEGVGALHLEERLCLLETHPSPEAAVELENNSLLEKALDLAGISGLQIRLRRKASGRLDRALEDHAILARDECLVCLKESLDSALGKTLTLHERGDLLHNSSISGTSLEAHALLSSRGRSLLHGRDVGRTKEGSDLADRLPATVAKGRAGSGGEGRAGAQGHAQRQDGGIVEVGHPFDKPL
mmetsp:Transcript_34142/g.80049  ORF Transcript_34142/g.80049 Transcript_34142/m.80049 type:complete len:556 (-) Transcript_34142:24-1691(-)